MAWVAKLNRIPNVLIARNLKKLRALMLINNLKHTTEFDYFDIQFAEGQWHAFFRFADMEQMRTQISQEVEGS